MISLQSLAELRENLPWGSQKEIAKRCGLSRLTVNKVLNGVFFNKKVIDTAIEYLKEIKEVQEDYKQKIKVVLNEA